MARYRPVTKYILARNHDIQGKDWRKGDIVHLIDVQGSDVPKVDVFLTHKPEYAKRGSKAPVHRTLREYIVIDGEFLTIDEPEELEIEEEGGEDLNLPAGVVLVGENVSESVSTEEQAE